MSWGTRFTVKREAEALDRTQTGSSTEVLMRLPRGGRPSKLRAPARDYWPEGAMASASGFIPLSQYNTEPSIRLKVVPDR